MIKSNINKQENEKRSINKVILISLIAVVIFFISACSVLGDFTFREEKGYRFVHDDEENAWWFKLNSVSISQESEDEPLLEAWVRIDYYKPLDMTELVLWYFRVDVAEYKSASNYTYGYDGKLLES